MRADYVIVGAGSAGAALAYRLSESGKHSVIIIEHGGSDWGPFIQMPAALSFPMNMSAYDWGYRTEPEPHLNGRRMAAPRGKVMGGSSSINGMVYVRGHARDFDQWDEMGATGWSHADVAPYFKRMETSATNDDGSRGNSGPLHVKKGDTPNPLFDAFIQAGIEAGFGLTPDYNGLRQEGFARFQHTIHEGRRWSTANAYLRPAVKRKNTSLVRGLAEKIVFAKGRATGVQIRRGTDLRTIEATKEVILAASAFNTPKLLMLSGIGPGEHLNERGIEVIANRPGVGQNLMDHLEVYIQQECTQPITLNSRLGLFSKARIGAEWLLRKSGPGATNHFEACAFVRSRAGVEYPDIQFHFLPAAIRYDGTAPAGIHGFQAHVGPMRSPSRGRVELTSPNPMDAPLILFNYMSTEEDWHQFRHCVHLAREIFGQQAFDFYRGRELQPGADVQSDYEIDAFIREHAESAYHPCGTARMGRVDDPHAVVDPECRVMGVDGLRIVDSSIFPHIPNGNINAPSIMVGEKAADHILGKTPLPRINQELWIAPDWQTSDRVQTKIRTRAI